MGGDEGLKLGLKGLATAAVFLVAGPLAGVLAAPLVVVTRSDMTFPAVVLLIIAFPFAVFFAYALGGLAALMTGAIAAAVSLVTPRWWLYAPGCGLIALAVGTTAYEPQLGLSLEKFLVLCTVAGVVCGGLTAGIRPVLPAFRRPKRGQALVDPAN